MKINDKILSASLYNQSIKVHLSFPQKIIYMKLKKKKKKKKYQKTKYF